MKLKGNAVVLEKIIDHAKDQNKNILILGAPRSGTHALGEELAALSNATNHSEICQVGYCDDPWHDVDLLCDAKQFTLAHIVQLTPKLVLARDVPKIKNSCLIVNIKRRDKVAQFASWIYFRVMDPTGLHGWHNHRATKTKFKPGEIEAKIEDIMQFQLEQLIDEYFLPDYRLCYEDLIFEHQTTYIKNQFTFDLPKMFSNLDLVEQHLGSWHHAAEHLGYSAEV